MNIDMMTVDRSTHMSSQSTLKPTIRHQLRNIIRNLKPSEGVSKHHYDNSSNYFVPAVDYALRWWHFPTKRHLWECASDGFPIVSGL